LTSGSIQEIKRQWGSSQGKVSNVFPAFKVLTLFFFGPKQQCIGSSDEWKSFEESSGIVVDQQGRTFS
jgi:hypothetical protein